LQKPIVIPPDEDPDPDPDSTDSASTEEISDTALLDELPEDAELSVEDVLPHPVKLVAAKPQDIITANTFLFIKPS
jgi:hypothetical protein